MMQAGPAEDANRELDTIAWDFLCSQYTGRNYWDWTLERRLDAYLRRNSRHDVLNDGTVYSAVVDRVMANMGRARSNGVFGQPHA